MPWLPEAKLEAIDAKAVWASDMLSLANVTIAFVVGPPDRAVRLLLQENRGKPSKFARAIKERHRGVRDCYCCCYDYHSSGRRPSGQRAPAT